MSPLCLQMQLVEASYDFKYRAISTSLLEFHSGTSLPNVLVAIWTRRSYNFPDRSRRWNSLSCESRNTVLQQERQPAFLTPSKSKLKSLISWRAHPNGWRSLPSPTHKKEVLTQENTGSTNHPHISWLIGQIFHARRGKLRRAETTNTIYCPN